ncbi:MAG: RidA family protein [Erysipelotrichaceae bacterium]|nr:RidA family protein [Erysipelotrichaceae bacterium]
MFNRAIHSDLAPRAIGPYSPAMQLGDFVYVSGQLPVVPETGELVSDDIREQTQQSINNMQAVLSAVDLELRHVVKTTVYMTDLSQFNEMNEVYGLYFQQPYPARSCVQVAALPKGAKVEIEALVIDTLRYERQTQGCGGCHSNDDSCESGCDGNCCG